MKLYKRQVFEQIKRFLGDDAVIVLHGARQVGKTSLLFYIRDWLTRTNCSVFYFDLEYPEILADFNKGPDMFLRALADRGLEKNKEAFVLIDEIQYLDKPSSFLKIIADHHKNIHLIVSGSSTFAMKSKFTDSLAGRTTAFEIYPLSFDEFLLFKETQLTFTSSPAPSTLAKLKELYREFIRFGGYPKVALIQEAEKKKQYITQIIDTYIRKDVRDLAHVEDVRKFNNLLSVLSAQSGQLLDITSLSRETTISYPTLRKYLSVLEETFVIKRVTPYSRNASVEISKNPKIFFFDTGIQTILWLHSFQETILGPVFETSIFSQLVKRHGRHEIHFWRTKSGAEIDFVLTKDQKPISIEVKLSFSSFSKRSVNAFIKRYNAVDWMLVALEGKKPSSHAHFPWEL